MIPLIRARSIFYSDFFDFSTDNDRKATIQDYDQFKEIYRSQLCPEVTRELSQSAQKISRMRPIFKLSKVSLVISGL